MKFKGKFDIRSWEELTGSSDLNARRRFPKTRQRIPFKLQRGDQSKGFKKEDIDPAANAIDYPIVKIDENLSYIRMRKEKYANKLLREVTDVLVASPMSRTFTASIFTQLSASISTSLSTLPDPIVFLAEDTPFTGSYFIADSSSAAQAYSGIANSLGYLDRFINNESPTATGATWSFANSASTFADGAAGNEFHQPEYTSSFIIRTYASGSNSGSYLGQVPVTSTASRGDSGKFYNYQWTGSNGIETSTAGYYRTVLDAQVFGDGNEETFATEFAQPTSSFYAAPREIITFPYNTVVASGSFDYATNFTHLVLPGNRNADPRPAQVVTLYWASGSSGMTGSNGLSGSISPSSMVPDNDGGGAVFDVSGLDSGSHIFLDAALTQPASGGYYSTMFIGGTSSVSTGYTVHVAGDGILGNTTPADQMFINPFTSSYNPASLIPAATRWNGLSFTST
jgi:hypothetical protein